MQLRLDLGDERLAGLVVVLHRHVLLLGEEALAVVAGPTGRHQVLPGMGAPSELGDAVVSRHHVFGQLPAAVVAEGGTGGAPPVQGGLGPPSRQGVSLASRAASSAF